MEVFCHVSPCLGKAVGSRRPALLQHQWDRGWWPWGTDMGSRAVGRVGVKPQGSWAGTYLPQNPNRRHQKCVQSKSQHGKYFTICVPHGDYLLFPIARIINIKAGQKIQRKCFSFSIFFTSLECKFSAKIVQLWWNPIGNLPSDKLWNFSWCPASSSLCLLNKAPAGCHNH